MRPARSLWLAALGIAAFVALCFLLQTLTTVRSSDLALHYSLVDYFTRCWSLPPQVVNPMMAGYSPISHMVAGGIGRVVGSGFLGMHFASLGFVFLIYVFLFLGLERQSLLSTLVSYALLFFAIAALHYSFALHGYEIIYTYFFAQVAGDAAFLALLWVLSGRDRSANELVLLPLLVFAMGWLYPLAQAKLAIGILALWLFELVRVWLATKTVDWRIVRSILILGALFAAAILLHPEFSHFRWIAKNNGATRQTLSLAAIGGLAALLFLASLALAALALARKIGLTRPVFIATVGVATVSAYLAQAVLYFGFGEASEYAVRKHAYAITTLLAVAAIALLVEGAERLIPRLRGARLPAFLAGGSAAIAAAFLVTLILISHYAEDRTEFLAYQREVRGEPLLKGQTLSLNRAHPGEFNLAITVVDLDLPGGLYPFIPLVLGRSQPSGTPTVFPRFALVSRTSSVSPGCKLAEPVLAHAAVTAYGCK